jgi:pyruvate carboxylase subunit B
MTIEYLVTVGGSSRVVAVRHDGDRLHVAMGGVKYSVSLEPRLGSTHFTLRLGPSVLPVVIRTAGEERLVGIGAEQYRLHVGPRLPIARRGQASHAGGAREVIAPMPGLVVAAEAAPGDRVEPGQVLVILEAMKMQSEIRAPCSGRVVTVAVRAGQEVMGGAVLAVIEPTG